MRDMRLDISDERAMILLYMFSKVKEHILNTDLIEPATNREFDDVMAWFEKAYDRRKALEAVNLKWGK